MNPYKNLPAHSFWKLGVTESYPSLKGLYKKKFNIQVSDKIATAGSCFAQHIARNMKLRNFNVLTSENKPPFLAEKDAEELGYGLFSARFANIYTTQQLNQLAQEALSGVSLSVPKCELNNRFFDILRPSVEPVGFEAHELVLKARQLHIEAVRKVFLDMDVFIFTMGLTEHWYDVENNLVLPVVPGVIAGQFSHEKYKFRNASFTDTYEAFIDFYKKILELREGRDFKVILTVSPVPLTATYENRHVLTSTVESKSILRSVAGQLSREFHNVDYFPSFEIITHPSSRSTNYLSNLRSISPDGVSKVMETFFEEHEASAGPNDEKRMNHEIVSGFTNCEEEALEL